MAKKKELEKPSLDELLKRTNTANPSKEDMALIRKHLDENPDMVKANDSTQAVIGRLMESYIPDSKLLREITLRQFDERRKELGYYTAPWIVRSLIDQVILCEFRLSRFELTHYNNTDGTRHTLTAGIYYEKRLSMMQRRFQKAVETLAKIRKLLAEAKYFEEKANAKSK